MRLLMEFVSPFIAGITFILLLEPLNTLLQAIILAKKRPVLVVSILLALIVIEAYTFLTVYIYWLKAFGAAGGVIMAVAKGRGALLNLLTLVLALYLRRKAPEFIKQVERCNDK